MNKIPTSSRGSRLHSRELIFLAVILGIFVGLTVLLTTRQPILAAIFFGITFIVAILASAMFMMSFTPNEEERPEAYREQNSEDLL